MNVKGMKVGDKVFIREDLIHLQEYGNAVYYKAKGSGKRTIAWFYNDNKKDTFVTAEDNCYYTPEMIDWEKTKKIRNIDFKEIIQCGECRKEITKATTYDGREITVKNSNEENDIEKAVMMLMLKAMGITYRNIEKEVEKVKWEPIAGEQFYYISTTPALGVRAVTYFTDGALKSVADVGNCFKTKEDAEEKIEKIKEVLRGE